MRNINIFNIATIYKFIQITIVILILIVPVNAWSNGAGSPSKNPNMPAISTHDKIIDSAIQMLPINLQKKIDITAAEYGTEMPDFNKTECNCIYGIGDLGVHHVYYWKNTVLQDDKSAKRAQAEYDLAMKNLSIGDKYNFSIHIGMMSHYISDISNFAHTMGNKTDWGAESPSVHGLYESYVAGHPDQFFSAKNITFDGKYDDMTAYNATLESAKDATFDSKFGKGVYTNVWMNNKVNNSSSLAFADSKFISRAKQSLNYNVNLIADVLYTMIAPKDILLYYKGLGQSKVAVETTDLLKAADDWRNDIVPPEFSVPITTAQLLTLADEWRNTPPFANVDISGFSFQPQGINVVKGTSITWTNKDQTNHTVTSNTGLFDSGNIVSGGTYSFTFDNAGSYSYHCNIHSSMTGVVTVS